MRDKIIEALGQKGIFSEVKDGMDGSIISYDFKNKTLAYSGAFNPTYLIRDNNIIEFNGDRMPLSYYDNISVFSSRNIKTRSNDLVYLFTDGYTDQFGGDDEKKFRRSRFKQLLLDNYKKPLTIQKEILLDTYQTWKGNREQVDDITVVGLKL